MVLVGSAQEKNAFTFQLFSFCLLFTWMSEPTDISCTMNYTLYRILAPLENTVYHQASINSA